MGKSNTKVQRKIMSLLQSLKSNIRFVWTPECEAAFQKLKTLLATPSVLMKPKLDLPVALYVSVGDTSAGVLLVQEMNKEVRIV